MILYKQQPRSLEKRHAFLTPRAFFETSAMKERFIVVFLLIVSSNVSASDSTIHSVPNYVGEDRYNYQAAGDRSVCDDYHASEKIEISNDTDSTIYYDVRIPKTNELYEQDRRLTPGESWTYCTKSNDQEFIIGVDADVNKRGIQLRSFNLTTGKQYKFVRRSHLISIDVLQSHSQLNQE